MSQVISSENWDEDLIDFDYDDKDKMYEHKENKYGAWRRKMMAM